MPSVICRAPRLTTVAHDSHEFEWKREECYMLRKPDPPVLVAITKEPAGRIKTKTVQILDYNLNRCVPPWRGSTEFER